MTTAAPFMPSSQLIFRERSPLRERRQLNVLAKPKGNVESSAPCIGERQNIVCAIDDSAHAYQAFAMALDLAERRQAQLHIVCVAEVAHVAELISAVDEGLRKEMTDARRLLEDVLCSKKARNVNIKTHILAGNPVRAIVGLASAVEAELLVIGRSRRSALSRRVFGSTADALLDTAPCPVVVAMSNS